MMMKSSFPYVDWQYKCLLPEFSHSEILKQMEPSMEVLSEGEWSSMYTTTEEANFVAQLLIGGELDSSSGLRSLDWHTSDETSFYNPSSAAAAAANFFPQIPNHDDTDHYLNNSTDEMMHQHLNGNVQLKEEEVMIRNSFESSRKRSRSTGNIQKLRRNVKLKKTQSFQFSSQTEEDGSNFGAPMSNQLCCSDQDDPNGSAQETTTLNLSGRTRASRGTATDPQSLYARKRRERINERLKVLQRLIPNGTKVDISTMLEEAVHYVKFLRLQIKLLSSDDLWMFAPIAYNGIDLGLNMR